MDFETIILGALATAVFLVPIIYIQMKQKGKAGKSLQVFLDAAKLQELQLSRYDFWNEQYGIGLDETKRKLYYWYNDPQHPKEFLADLSSIRKSEVENVFREVNANRVIDHIGLRLALQGAKSPEAHLRFYSKDSSMMLNGELQLAEKWSQLINASVKDAPQTVTH